jgi:nucleoside-diphosphate-sugar epimerase
VLVAGCGFIGAELVRVFHDRGLSVFGLTLRKESAARLSAALNVEILAADIGDETAFQGIATNLADRLTRPLAVIHCASSNRGGPPVYRNVFLRGTHNLLRYLKPERFVFTSSTSVYAQLNGEVVDETSPAEPVSQTGQILLEAEKLVRESGGIVARLAGLYGPGRCVYLKHLKSGAAVFDDDADRFVNMLHRDDAVSAIQRLLQNGASGEVYNVADNTPRTLRELYTVLSRRTGLPLPTAGAPAAIARPARKRPITSKRVSNARLRQLGWNPRYPAIEAAWITLHEQADWSGQADAPG